MKQVLLLFTCLILLFIAFLGGARFSRLHEARSEPAGTSNRQILHYVDPMNPAHTTKEPGIAPCGMPMEPVYADDPVGGAVGASEPGTVRVDAAKQQHIGVRLATVGRSAPTMRLRALGRIVADENRVYPLIAATDGWMEGIQDVTTGSLVQADQVLGRIRVYSYDFYTWQQRLLAELGYTNRLATTPSPLVSADQSRRRTMSGAGYEAGLPIPESESRFIRRGATIARLKAEQQAQSPPQQDPAASQVLDPTTTPPAATRDMDHDHGAMSPGNGAGRAKAPVDPHAGHDMAAMGTAGQTGRTPEDNLLYASRGRQELLNLGVSEEQLQAFTDTGAYITHVALRSPVSGLVTAREVSPLQRVERGLTCFTVTDLSRVWVEADLFGVEAERLQPGLTAHVTLPGHRQPVEATVSQTLPLFDGASRTLRVRLEMDNPELAFRPGMFTDVEFQIPLAEALSVPTSAMLNTGRRKIVYVLVGENLFVPREVQTGWQTADLVEITAGLEVGDRVAASGTFLLDSESRMRLAAAGLMTDQPATVPAAAAEPQEPQPAATQSPAAQPAPTPPVATQPPSKPDAAVPVQPAAPSEPPPEPVVSEAAVVPPVPPAQAAAQARDQAATIKDPVCGMEVDPQQARAAGLTLEVAGVTHFFCSEACKQQFQQEPSGATGAPAGTHAHDLPPDHGKGAHD